MASAPRPAATQTFVQQSWAHDKVFALTQYDARVSNVVVEGMISLAGHTARVLFDPGATHLFVSIHLHLNLINTLKP